MKKPKTIFDILKEFKQLSLNDSQDLGEPTKTENVTVEGVNFIKYTYITKNDEVITILETTDDISSTMTDAMFMGGLNDYITQSNEYSDQIELTNEEMIDLLELKLTHCLSTENYERAAIIRDEINLIKTK